MLLPFEVAAGSITGRRHIGDSQVFVGEDNQDKFALINEPSGIVSVVCDGCSGQHGSDNCESGNATGAVVGSRIVAHTIAREIANARLALLSTPKEFWSRVQEKLLERVTLVIEVMFGERDNMSAEQWEKVIMDNFLFTILAGVVTEERTQVAVVGDGVLAVNGNVRIIHPDIENAPNYLAKALLEPRGSPVPEHLNFRLLCDIPTSELQSMFLATDGAEELIAKEHTPIPGRSSLVGPLRQLWEDDTFFASPFAMQLWLRAINREDIRFSGEGENRRLVRSPGLVQDDIALVSLRRKGGFVCPLPSM